MAAGSVSPAASSPMARRLASMTVSERRAAAWRYEGYRGFSNFLAFSPYLPIFRRFNALQARVLLYKQDEIAQLEEELEEIDLQCMQHDGWEGVSNTTRVTDIDDRWPRRKEIINELERLFQSYNEYLLAYSELMGRPSAKPRQIRNIQTWLQNFPDAIAEDEARFVGKGNDLLSLNPNNKMFMHSLMERMSDQILYHFFKLKPQTGDGGDGDGKSVVVGISEARLAVVAVGLTVAVGMLLLIIPMWWLSVVYNKFVRLGVITGFVVVFASILFTATGSERPFEVLAGTAAYAAVLTVYVQAGS